MDETYRNSKKLDHERFATKFDPEEVGIVKFVRECLLDGVDQGRKIRVEMDGLNVYDQGSFSNPHKNTLRSADMFGSVIVVFPTPHQGGDLVLRCDAGEEWTFDSSQLLSNQTTPKAAIIAFYSDVEHEVSLVESGHRVTLTYNLYYEDVRTTSRGKTIIKPAPQVPALHTHSTSNPTPILQSIPDEILLRTTLTSLLQDPNCLPDHGFFGFGLRFKYPFENHIFTDQEFQRIFLDQLKGSDAVIKRVCDSLSLPVELRFVID
ncbi:hypothetical protein BDN72DRAFT_801586, partial [Pluteus cervinus]